MSDPTLSDSDADLLESIGEALPRVALYTDGSDEDRFLEDQRTIDAVALNILVVGECARQLSEGTKIALPAPWPDIVALRHRIAHGYASVQPLVLWKIAVEYGPRLARQIEALEFP